MSQNIWIIDGEAYDLSKFKHPAGPIALECGRNRDATMLFKSYHAFTEKPLEVLKKYKVKTTVHDGIERQTEFDFSKPNPFWEELRAEVKQVLKDTSPYATRERWLHIALMAILVILCSPFYFQGYWWAMFVFPIVLWIFGVNTFHDASHFALSRNWRVNAFFTYLGPMFSSPFTWYHQHVIGHHVYTNIKKKDPDVHHGAYLWRYHHEVRWYKHYKWQLYYVWFIWCNICMSLAFTIDILFMIRGSYHYVVKSMEMTRRRKYLHFIGRFLTFLGIYVWPFLHPQFSWFKAFMWAIIPYYIYGMCFSFSSQLNHLIEDNMKYSSDWFEHQVLTSHTWAPDSYLWFIFTGGLNLQTEHHLFPGVNHWNLRKIQPIVQKYCKKYGYQYNLSKTVSEAFMKHMYWLEKMSHDPKKKE